VPAPIAVIPGPAQPDRPEHRVHRLVPVAGEPRLVAGAAARPRAGVAGVSGQQVFQHAAAQPDQPGADHLLGSLQPGAARQRRRRRGGQPGYLRGGVGRERRSELLAQPPLFCPSLSWASPPGTASGARASQIASFTASI